ncbi:MAG: metallophosphoesterase [Aggregatilineales bacterium]|nr:metallophosphoesterase [Chloroflexota bacterium]HOA24728.1 metallophosphoesterase [Aggregatilineales bacterium]HPV07766.1 metallophosphoesterase [Aggregatilineales bacterium]HQE20034.1 metallophosphoesterase [Aggregatilineales bacterium]
MQIAICSDIHDNIWKLETALQMMRDVEALIFCGDFCAPFTLTQLAEGINGPVHAVLGNNDGDPRLLLAMAQKAGNATLHGQFAELELGGRRIAVNHYPEIARGLAASGQYDVVCYGHDHTLHEERVGETLLVNPGEIMGRFGRSTFMLLDTDTLTVTVHDVE